MARSKIKDKQKTTIQIGESSGESSSSSKIKTTKTKKSSIGRGGAGKPKKPRSEAQRNASKANLEKARQARANYRELRKTGFTRETIVKATDLISEILNNPLFDPETNPAVDTLMKSTGGIFKTDDEIEKMTKSEYYKYATSIREFLGSPLSAQEGISYLVESLDHLAYGKELLRGFNEEESVYKKRRKAYIDAMGDKAKQAFEIYRKLLETNAGQILKQIAGPAAYGSDNMIVDIFDFVENEWSDGDIDNAAIYWSKRVNEIFTANQEFAREKRMSPSLKLGRIDWKAGENYGQFIQSLPK